MFSEIILQFYKKSRVVIAIVINFFFFYILVWSGSGLDSSQGRFVRCLFYCHYYYFSVNDIEYLLSESFETYFSSLKYIGNRFKNRHVYFLNT